MAPRLRVIRCWPLAATLSLRENATLILNTPHIQGAMIIRDTSMLFSLTTTDLHQFLEGMFASGYLFGAQSFARISTAWGMLSG